MPSIFIRAITPKRSVGLDPAHFLSELNKEMKDIGKQAEKEMAKPTRQWKSKPQFETKFSGGTRQIVMVVHPIGPGAENYERIDFGTSPHVIRPRPPHRFLRFMPKYLASTIPNRLWSRVAKSSGGFVYARVVHHPGTEAREFSEQVYKIMNPEFRRQMRNLLTREMRRKGV